MNYVNRYLRLNVYPQGTSNPVVFDTTWRIQFRVKKFASSNYLSFNQAEISVYNMTSELRTTLAQRDMSITLIAGYEDKKNPIFDGVINNVVTSKSGTDLITTFYCSSNIRNYNEPVQISTQNMTVTDVLKKICTEHGIRYELPFTRAEIIAKSYSGTLAKVVAMICYDYKLSAGIDNGVLVFKNKLQTASSIADDSVYTFTPNTGMLGSPTVNERGVSLQSLLNPDIRVNDYFKLYAPYANYNLNTLTNRPNAVLGGELNAMAFIDTSTYNGLYMALSLEFQGDTRSNSWYTHVEGSRVWDRGAYGK